MENDLLRETLNSLEERLLQPDIRTSADELNLLLADDFLEFGRSGKDYNKQQTIDGLAKAPSLLITLMNFEIKPLAPNVMLVTYLTVIHCDMAYSLRSSIWKFNDGAWQMIFHQGTPTTAPC